MISSRAMRQVLVSSVVAGTVLMCAPCFAAEGAGGGVRLCFVVFGGTEGKQDAHEQIVAQMVKCRPELTLHAGGMVWDGRDAEQWACFDALTKPLRDLCPLYACHSAKDGGTLFGGRFRLPDGTVKPNTYYAFDHKGVRFIALDSEKPPKRRDPQTDWLKQTLAEADGRHIFVFFHKPIINVAWRKTVGSARPYWMPLFSRHKVRAVFHGGHHLYFRMLDRGVSYVTTGGGGAPLDDIRSRRNMTRHDAAAKFHHFVEVTVDGDDVLARVIDLEGRTRDQFRLGPPPARR